MSVIPQALRDRMTPIVQLKLAKTVSPGIFENATPRIHLDVLEHVFRAGSRCAVVMFRGAGKSTLLNKVHILARIFFLHEPFTIIVSENASKAQSFLRDIKRMILDAEMLGLDIHKGEIWNERMIEVVTGGKRVAVAAFGAGEDPRGYVYNNIRPTFILADDIESRELVRSQAQREKLAEWFFQDLLPALHPDGDVLIVGTIMHEEQLLSKILRNPEWKSIVIPCYKEDGSPAWPSRWPREKLERVRREFEAQGLFHAFANEYLCVPQNTEKQLFKREMYRYFKGIRYGETIEKKTFKNAITETEVVIRTPEAIVLEDGSEIPYQNLLVYTTGDLASDGKDKTCFFTKGYDSHGNEYNLDISAGHWNPFEKSVQAMRIQMQFRPIRFGLEKAGAQNDFFYTIDVAQKEFGVYIPVEELRHGGVNKNIRIANRHPLYSTGKIHHNRSDPNTPLLEAQLGAFNIDIQSGVDDIIDAEAYHQQFTQGRTFESDLYDYDDEYNEGPWG